MQKKKKKLSHLDAILVVSKIKQCCSKNKYDERNNT